VTTPGTTSSIDIDIRRSTTQKLELRNLSFPTDTWQTFSYTLDTTENWRFSNGSSSRVATQADFDTIFAAVNDVIIRADWVSGLQDTYLDNVSLVAVPEPVSAALLGLCSLFVLCRRRHRS